MGTAWRDWMRDDRPRGSGGNPGTWWVLGVCTALWFVHAIALRMAPGATGLDAWIRTWLLLHPEDVVVGWRLWQPFTALWLHDPGGVGHVFVNMLLLFLVGRETERMLGTRGFLALYLGAGLASTLLLVLLALGMDLPGPFGGATGAIYGTGVFLALRRPTLRVLVLFVEVPLWALVAFGFVGLELLGLLVWGGGVERTLGHLAGAAWGLVHHRLGLFPRRRLRGAGPRPQAGPQDAWTGEARSREAEVRDRVDGLLAKIQREGIGALSEEEKSFLERASRHFRSR